MYAACRNREKAEAYMKKFVVISHTHWDREWYMSFSVFRLKLVDLIDRLFLILQKDNDFIFHLDAQTVVLEDYLEIRPENESLLRKYIKNGNIRVGPWYLQNDFYLTDGEATVRNLMVGTAIAESFGKCGKVGYAPDQFGNISQLPQILADFGIDNFVFGRGFRDYEIVDGERREKRLPAEFEWVGADGTRCLAVHLKHWYNNAQHIPEEKKLAELLLDINEKNFDGLNVSPYILLMNGVDHLEAQDSVLDVISSLKASGRNIEQMSLDAFMDDVRKAVKGKNMPEYCGALNKGTDYDLLKGCWASRIYLKSSNVRCEDLLENKLEPLYAYMEQSGFKGVYPTGEMNYLWKLLLKNHPHDSICGCSIDPVHRHMEDSFERITEMGKELVSRGLKTIAHHSGHPLAEDKNYCITVFNGTERTVSEVAETELNFILSENVESFALMDSDNKSVPYEIVESKTTLLDVFSPLNLPGVLDVNRVKIRFTATDVPAYSAKVFAVVPNAKGEIISSRTDGAENEFYKIYADGNALCIKDKRNGKVYKNPLILEDAADKGDSYVYRVAPQKPLNILPTSFEAPVCGALKSGITVNFDYDCPEHYDFENDCRSGETVRNSVKLTLELKAKSDVIAISYVITNNARDHRMRLKFACGIDGGKIFTDSPFDYDERLPRESCDLTDSDTHHNSTFAQLVGANEAFTVFTEGQHELENAPDGLIFTVLRSTGVINRDGITFKVGAGECWDAPGNQCLRSVSGRMGIRFGEPKSGAQCFADGKLFRNGLLALSDSFDSKKYSGGRFAVQATELAILYYVKDKYANCTVLPQSFFKLDSDKIAVTCCKAGKKGGAVVRFVNLADSEVDVELSYKGTAYRTTMSEREEKSMGKNKTLLTFSPKQIITVRFDINA